MIIRIVIVMAVLNTTIQAQNPEDIMKDVMQSQQDCWNSGNLECSMKGYWDSDSLVFVSSSRVYYGYDKTLERYRNTYPNQEAMGTLEFTIISLQSLSDASYYMIGKFHLEREIGNLEGHFTLLWRKINNQWLIVSDHSS
ncbi:MAG: hypothetical protein DHS20C17_15250 [Cyclobacteriaceae bacterium]|nr:MAG: hypothetical protein DHS20C17_15250 [Cyclobacteriaceae bacterium]